MGTNKKINVCHLISGDLWAGAEVQMYTLITALKAMPELYISSIVLNEGKLVEKLRSAGAEVFVIEERKNGFFQILDLIKDSLRNKKIDILHTHRYKENILGAMLKKYGLIPHLIQTVHGIGEPFKGIRSVKAKIYSHLNFHYTKRYFDKVLTVSQDIQNVLSRKMDSDKFVTIHNAINPANLKVTKTPDEIRNDLGIKNNENIIGTAGRMVPVKGYDIFLDMAKIIISKKTETRFLLIGDGPLLEGLRKKAQEIGLESEVMFLGFRDDIIDIINCLDIFVISSYHEGIPMVLLEAMALKKAVVSTAVGGINEIVKNNVSGLLVGSGDAATLADNCIEILENMDVKIELGIAAANRIKEEFSIETQKSRVLSLYREVVFRQ